MRRVTASLRQPRHGAVARELGCHAQGNCTTYSRGVRRPEETPQEAGSCCQTQAKGRFRSHRQSRRATLRVVLDTNVLISGSERQPRPVA